MNSKDLDDLLAELRQAGRLFATLYKDLTGDEFDADSVVRHYPVAALGLAAGAGVAAGWWLGRRNVPQLPPPPPAEPVSKRALDLVDDVLPGAVDRVRARLPEVVLSDETRARVKTWMGNIAEHQVQQGIDRWAEGAEVKLGSFFRRATERLDREEEVRLEDPEESETPDQAG